MSPSTNRLIAYLLLQAVQPSGSTAYDLGQGKFIVLQLHGKFQGRIYISKCA